MDQAQIDRRFMRRAINLSRKGFPAPNPHVGCVIVASHRIVGEGYHDHAGGPHAEAVALAEAGESARGSDVYTTLEPCNHFGRTPPCSLALVKAGVRRVVVAERDNSPKAAGGMEALRAEGIQVVDGVLTEEAAGENRMFVQSVALGRPYVIVKVAATLDSKIATLGGESHWITGPRARKEGHRLRAECGAVLVGRKTVEADNPQLTARIPGVTNQPLRIVLDPRGKLGPKYRVFSDAAETWHITGAIDLKELLERCHKAGHIGLLVEGGAETIGHFLSEDLVDELRMFVAPRLIGPGLAWTGGFEAPSLALAKTFEFKKPRIIGEDVELTALRIRP